jgi:hypothetical protein
VADSNVKQLRHVGYVRNFVMKIKVGLEAVNADSPTGADGSFSRLSCNQPATTQKAVAAVTLG